MLSGRRFRPSAASCCGNVRVLYSEQFPLTPARRGDPEPSPRSRRGGRDGRGHSQRPPQDLGAHLGPWEGRPGLGLQEVCRRTPGPVLCWATLLFLRTPRPWLSGTCPAVGPSCARHRAGPGPGHVGQRGRGCPGGSGHCRRPSSWREATCGALRKGDLGWGDGGPPGGVQQRHLVGDPGMRGRDLLDPVAVRSSSVCCYARCSMVSVNVFL